MKLTKEDIQQFKILYQEQFGKVLSDDEAQEQAFHCLQYAYFELKPCEEVRHGK